MCSLSLILITSSCSYLGLGADYRSDNWRAPATPLGAQHGHLAQNAVEVF